MSVRVACEYAGSGQPVGTFDFDFFNSTYSALEDLVVALDTSLCYFNLRLFLGHNGLELSISPGAFGRQLHVAEVEAAAAWRAAQKSQQELLPSEDNNIVLSVSTSNKTDVLARLLQDRPLCLSLQSWILCYTSHQVLPETETTANCDGYLIRVLALEKLHLVVTSQQSQTKAIDVHIMGHEMVRSASIMAAVTKYIPSTSYVIDEALRSNMDFMVYLTKLRASLPSKLLLDNQEFARKAFTTFQGHVRGNIHLYTHLSKRLQRLPEIVRLAVYSTGIDVLQSVPEEVRDDKTLMLACVKRNCKAIQYMSDKLFKDDGFVELCLIEAYKQGLNGKKQSVLLEQRAQRSLWLAQRQLLSSP